MKATDPAQAAMPRPFSAPQVPTSGASPVGVLPAADDFSRVLRARRIGVSRHFELYAAAPATDRPRIGLAIGKKTAPTAVLRNLVKRIARESARAYAPRLAVHDYVLRSRRGLADDWAAAKLARQTSAFKRDLRGEIDTLLTRSGPPAPEVRA